MLAGLTKKPMLLLALAAGAYYLFLKPKTTTASSTPLGPGSSASGVIAQDVTAGANAATGLINAVSNATSGTNGFGFGGLPSELRGIDGMAPASLSGHMASLGAYGDLGGNFYGGY